MTTQAIGRSDRTGGLLSAAARQHLGWLAGGLALGFLVPFVFADRIGVPRDGYYAIYVVAALTFLAAWTRSTGRRPIAMIRRHWIAAVSLGLACAGILAAIVVGTEDAGTRAGGAELVGALLWRGVVYGAVDGLLLSAFPILAVFGAFAGTRARRSRRGRVAVGALALVASLAMTAAYHAGYAQFRSEDMRAPLAGDVIWSAPTLATLNPVGAPIAHIGLHTSAVLHSPDTELFLPPSGTGSR